MLTREQSKSRPRNSRNRGLVCAPPILHPDLAQLRLPASFPSRESAEGHRPSPRQAPRPMLGPNMTSQGFKPRVRWGDRRLVCLVLVPLPPQPAAKVQLLRPPAPTQPQRGLHKPWSSQQARPESTCCLLAWEGLWDLGKCGHRTLPADPHFSPCGSRLGGPPGRCPFLSPVGPGGVWPVWDPVWRL